MKQKIKSLAIVLFIVVGTWVLPFLLWELGTTYRHGSSLEPVDTLKVVCDTLEAVYDNSVKGHKEEKYVVGNFIKGKTDTLRVEWIDEYYDGDIYLFFHPDPTEYLWRIASSNPSIPPLYIEYNVDPKLVFEGDLDGNGTDEIGIVDTWVTSSCRAYRIYTLQNGKWMYLIDPLETAENLRNESLELALPCGIKNKVRVRYSDFNAERSSCASAPIIDTIIPVKPRPVEKVDVKQIIRIRLKSWLKKAEQWEEPDSLMLPIPSMLKQKLRENEQGKFL